MSRGVQVYVPQLEVLASFQGELCLGLAHGALQPQNDFLGGLGLLSEDRLGLTTVTALLTIVTTLTLSEQGGLEKFEKSQQLSIICPEGRESTIILPGQKRGIALSPCQPCTG